jgi:hypothetical protein
MKRLLISMLCLPLLVLVSSPGNTFAAEQITKLLNDLGEMIRISGTAREARYLLLRKGQPREAGSEITFRNLDGEWRMDSF